MAWRRVTKDHFFDKLSGWLEQLWERYTRKKPEDMPPQVLIEVPESPKADESIVFERVQNYFPRTTAEQFLLACGRRPHVLLAVTGCDGAENIGALYRSIQGWSLVKVVATDDAIRYLETIPHVITADDIIVRVDLQRWADVLIVAPLSINTLVSISVGRIEDLVTHLVRDWERTKPLFIGPSMTRPMWQCAVTKICLRLMVERRNAIIF